MIEKIHVLAGPTGAGKSTLTRNPGRLVSPEGSTSAVRDFLRVSRSLPALRAMGPQNYLRLASSETELFIHVDFWNAFSGSPVELEQAYPQFNKLAFRNWRSLQNLYRIPEVFMYTMFVSRPVLFDRWIGREIAQGRTKINAKLANFYGNVKDRNRPFWCLYGAWFDFVSDLAPRTNIVIEADTRPYRFVDFADWDSARKLLVVRHGPNHDV